MDQPKFQSMCSVPLIWNDQVVGVLNVQTERRRRFTRQDVAFLEALAGLLAGFVERNRLQREAEAQLESLRAIDEARAHLVAVVTHALRTPLAVVRAYVELLGNATRRMAGRDEASEASAWERSALEQVDRLDQTVDSILASLRVLTPDAGPVVALDVAAVVDDLAREMAPMFRRQKLAASFVERPLRAYASVDQLRRLLGYLLENAAKYAPGGGHDRHLRLAQGRPDIPRHHRRRAGHSGRLAGEDLRAVRAPGRLAPRLRHRPVRGAPPGALDGRRAARRGSRAARQPVRAGAASCRASGR